MLPLLAAGVGAAAQTLSGSQGSAPQRKIDLGPSGQRLEASLFNAISSGGIPYNLAARYLGQAKKIAQGRLRQGRSALQAAGAGNTSGTTSGRSLVLLRAINAQRLTDATTGPKELGEARITQGGANVQNMQAFAGQQLQVPITIAQNQAARQQYSQLMAARKGAALGSLAELAGASYFYSKG